MSVFVQCSPTLADNAAHFFSKITRPLSHEISIAKPFLPCAGSDSKVLHPTCISHTGISKLEKSTLPDRFSCRFLLQIVAHEKVVRGCAKIIKKGARVPELPQSGGTACRHLVCTNPGNRCSAGPVPPLSATPRHCLRRCKPSRTVGNGRKLKIQNFRVSGIRTHDLSQATQSALTAEPQWLMTISGYQGIYTR